MKLPIFQVDAFTGRVFGGNPAAVCPLETWLDDRTMQAIAAENNLSETAFFVEARGHYDLRWFTPAAEVDLCGHATLATAHVLFTLLDQPSDSVAFETRSGRLTVRRDGTRLVMDFPALAPEPWDDSKALDAAMGRKPAALLGRVNCVAVYESEAEVRGLAPDIGQIAALPYAGVIATAPGDAVDFVSRYFAPKFGIPEDPVTGSAHCELAPYWAERLGRKRLVAHQASNRGGELDCEVKGDRVLIGGRAVTYLEGVIEI